MSTRRIAYTGLFIALAVALGFALVAVPNVEMITATIFIAGWVMGPVMGALVGVIAETIYSGMNPVGSGFLFPPLLIAQVISYGFIGFAGGVLRRGEIFFLASKPGYIALGTAGALLTLLYDVLTTLSYPFSAGFTGAQIWTTLIAGLGLSAVHVVVNFFIFSILVPQILKSLYSQLGLTEVIR